MSNTTWLTREGAARMLDEWGSLTVSTKRRRHADGQVHVHYTPRYRLVHTDRDGLESLHAQFGGTIYKHGRDCWAWQIAQGMLATVLEDVLPYMNEKRRQAELILELVELKANGNDREPQRKIVEELRQLNAKAAN